MTKEETLEQLESLIEAWELCEADLNQTDINAIKYIIKENNKQDQIISEAKEKLNQDIGDLINYGDGHFIFPSEIVKSLKLYLEILDRNVK